MLAEIFRAGIIAVPRGQREAAYALGLRKTQVMRLVLLPQAVRAMLPAIISQLVVLLKDTALGFIITYEELLLRRQADRRAGAFDFPYVLTYLIVAAIYIATCVVLSLLASWLEKRSRRSRKHRDDRADPRGRRGPHHLTGPARPARRWAAQSRSGWPVAAASASSASRTTAMASPDG